MSELTRKIERGFTNIARAKSGSDAEKAYVEYHQLLETEKPWAHELKEVGVLQGLDLGLTDKTRLIKYDNYHRGDGYSAELFRGTGALALGTLEGNLLFFDYHSGMHDPVGRQYGSYQRVALRKAGQGLLVARNCLERPESSYPYLEEVLVSSGLKEATPTHHLGYAHNMTLRRTGMVLVAGATGMLPSNRLKQDLQFDTHELVAADREVGLVEWEGDELAGFYDYIAAYTLVRQASGQNVQNPTIRGLADEVKSRHLNGQNLH